MSNTTPNEKTENPAQLKSDVVLLVDIVTEHSRQVKLVDYESLKHEFIEKAADAEPLTKAEIRESIESAPKTIAEQRMTEQPEDSPEGKEKRRLMSRRAMLSHLFKEELKAEQETAAPEKREVTEEYFEQVLSEALKGPYGLSEHTSWDKIRYFNFEPLLSDTYARLLSAQNNPYELVLDTIRENSRIYPRPLGLYCFEYPPFNLSPEVIQEIVDRMPNDENAKDIRVTVTPLGSVYLYSSTYLEDDYADFLAESMDDQTAEML
jgi:hypothetical protein